VLCLGRRAWLVGPEDAQTAMREWINRLYIELSA